MAPARYRRSDKRAASSAAAVSSLLMFPKLAIFPVRDQRVRHLPEGRLNGLLDTSAPAPAAAPRVRRTFDRSAPALKIGWVRGAENSTPRRVPKTSSRNSRFQSPRQPVKWKARKKLRARDPDLRVCRGQLLLGRSDIRPPLQQSRR